MMSRKKTLRQGVPFLLVEYMVSSETTSTLLTLENASICGYVLEEVSSQADSWYIQRADTRRLSRDYSVRAISPLRARGHPQKLSMFRDLIKTKKQPWLVCVTVALSESRRDPEKSTTQIDIDTLRNHTN